MADKPTPDVNLDSLPPEQAVALLNRVLADPDQQADDAHAIDQTPIPQIGDPA